MKYKKLIYTFSIFSMSILNAQVVKRLNDEAIVSQHKRMVFERWGDFRPYPKYNFLGIQTNLLTLPCGECGRLQGIEIIKWSRY
ncbi:hypothetical protein [Bergeyella cardium]|uniref:Uncharacterized protein n=1 Tax=Bergeyella cardium TaxID=1585976 RepID=A0A6P1QRB0_9FLAO|nr:hypothetical protein [Bergeyella cardium]QHN64622.1 hypothetical protein DBX24_01290 [Bergeyella cardium]WHE33917.1 hypothetical protein P8603_01290 [Bergeyella cardium]